MNGVCIMVSSTPDIVFVASAPWYSQPNAAAAAPNSQVFCPITNFLCRTFLKKRNVFQEKRHDALSLMRAFKTQFRLKTLPASFSLKLVGFDCYLEIPALTPQRAQARVTKKTRCAPQSRWLLSSLIWQDMPP